VLNACDWKWAGPTVNTTNLLHSELMFGVSVSLGSGTIASLISVFRHFDVCVLDDITCFFSQSNFLRGFCSFGKLQVPSTRGSLVCNLGVVTRVGE